MKECKTCKVDFDEPYGKCNPCREKNRLYKREYYPKNKDRINAERKAKRDALKKPKECPTCGNGFEYIRSDKVYCNPKCYPSLDKELLSKKNKMYRSKPKAQARIKTYRRLPHVKKKACERVKAAYWKDPEKYRKLGRHESLTQEQIEKKRIANREYMSKNGRKNYYANHEENKEKLRNYVNNRLKTDVQYALNSRFRSLMNQHLRYKGIPKNCRTYEGVGYTPNELKLHFESQFTDGMSWDNMSEWHIDHIRPVASFNFTTTECEDFKKCWALNNLQPLWAMDNFSKGNKWDGVVNA